MSYKIDWFKFSEPFISSGSGEETWHLEIDCECLIDAHDYHDAPSSVELWFTREELEELRDKINFELEKVEALDAKS